MAKKQPDYPPEYRQQLVELVRAGWSADALAREFDPSPQTIRNWGARADRDDGKRGDGLTSHERDELRRLRRDDNAIGGSFTVCIFQRHRVPSSWGQDGVPGQGPH